MPISYTSLVLMNYLKTRVVSASRGTKLNQFYALCSGGRILDAGVSARARIPDENIFLSTFRYPGHCYVGLGVENLSELASQHPDKTFFTYDGKIFPFEDNEFDWAFSNAVIEHVGDHSRQVLFLNEMLRVARNVFFTTPNKTFPVESHTNVFFLHWLPGDTFYAWCRRNRPYWTRSNLNLLSHAALLNVIRSSNADSYRILVNRFLGWPMTFSVVCRK
jgi:hypothetical protein